MFALRSLRQTKGRTFTPIRWFGLYKDFFGSVKNKEGKYETAQERLEKGWKQEEDRINEKYFKVKSNPNSIYYYSMQYLNKLEKDLQEQHPAAKNKLKK